MAQDPGLEALGGYDRLIAQGAEYHRQGKAAEAERAYLAALARAPERNEAQRLLAVLAIARNDFNQAAILLNEVLERDVKDPLVLHEIALGFAQMNNVEESREAHTRAIALKPDFLDALLSYAGLLSRHGESKEAVLIYARAHRRFPRDPRPLAELSRVLVYEGDFPQALEVATKALESDPENIVALSSIARARKFSPGDPMISVMEKVLEKGDLSVDDRRVLHQSLGKIFDDCGDFDRAFEHFRIGNAAGRKAYDHTQQQARWRELKEVFSAAFFEERRGWGSPSMMPFFIVGMPRSGTTLTEQVLSSHARVFGGGELGKMIGVAAAMPRFSRGDQRYPFCLRDTTSQGIELLAERYLEELRRQSGGASHITDKYPHNFEHIGLISLLFPKAKIIACTRDPRDVGVSIFLNLMASPYPWSSSFEDIADHYKAHRDLMEHWDRVLPGKIHHIRYETFVKDFEAEVRRLLDYCELEFDEACLNYSETARSVRTPSAWQVRQPVYTGSVERWRRYESHIGPLQALAP